MFLESILFKNLKISKTQFCPVLATQSRVSQVVGLSRFFAGYFWRLVREWKVQSRGLLKDFRGSARDSLAGRPSSREKHLENFFKFLSLSVLAAWTGDFVATHSSREKRVFGKNRGNFFLNLFQFFPQTFVTVHLLSKLSPSQTLRVPIFKPHWCFISYPNHQEKVWVLFYSSHFPFFLDVFITIWIDIVFWYLHVVDSENLLLNEFGIYMTCSFHLFVCWCWFTALVYCAFMLT